MNKFSNQKLIFFTFLSILIIILFAFYNKNSLLTMYNHFMSNYFVQIPGSFDTNISSEDFLTNSTHPFNKGNLLFNVLIIADYHESDDAIPKIYEIYQDVSPIVTFLIGDLTDYGDKPSLNAVKEQFSFADNLIVIPGDHDIASTSSLDNFESIFGSPRNVVEINNVRLGTLLNYANFTPFSDLQHKENLVTLFESDVLFLSQPIYMPNNDIFSDKYMGNFSDDKSSISIQQMTQLKRYLVQRDQYINVIRSLPRKMLIMSADHHRSLLFKDPINENITYFNLGAVSKNVYLGNMRVNQKVLQPRRVTILEVYKSNNTDSGPFEYKIVEKMLE